MNIEQATIDDVETLAELWVSLAADQKQHGSLLEAEPNHNAATETLARHIAMDRVLVAREDDAGNNEICGFVVFQTQEGTYSQTVQTGEIVTLYVVPEARNQGVGTNLLCAAEAALAAAGVEYISLSVLADNEDARRLYRRAGYDTHRVELTKRIENDTHSKDDA